MSETTRAELARAQRYDLITNYRCGSAIEEMERADDGEWIRYEDVDAAFARLAPPEPSNQQAIAFDAASAIDAIFGCTAENNELARVQQVVSHAMDMARIAPEQKVAE